MVKLNSFANGCKAEVILKSEGYNQLFSMKYRIGKSMIEAAEADGSLKPGGTIIEPTSGNTGIALAFVARSKGYRCILTMPETMSIERRVLLKMLGAEIVLTPGPKGMGGAIAKARQLLEKDPEAFGPSQFDNPANPEVHRKTTAEEIWRDTGGEIDVFVAGVGTGGTITGVSEVIKARRDLHTVAVEPSASPVISGGDPGPHKIQGIGAGFIPGNLNTEIVDEVVQVSNEDAVETAQQLCLLEGFPAGISSGATIWAALQVAKREEMAGKRVVVIAASATERYLSTPLAESVREEVANLPVSEI
jgi:cysteine synthase A